MGKTLAVSPLAPASFPELPVISGVRFASAEEIIDLDAVLAGITDVIEGFYEGQATREG